MPSSPKIKKRRYAADLKNKLFLMISVIMACSLCVCGQQEAGAMTNGFK